jgi:hypothetical protein
MFQEPQDSLEMVEQKLRSIHPDPGFVHNVYVLAAIEDAILAVKEGNFGVGAVDECQGTDTRCQHLANLLVGPSKKVRIRQISIFCVDSLTENC